MAEAPVHAGIFAAMLEAAKEVKYVKRASVPKAGTGVLRDVVVAEVRPILLKHGIIAMTTQVGEGRVIATDQTSSGGTPKSIYLGRYQTSFICVADGSTMSVVNEALGEDYGDKAPGKARTYAEKMNLIGGLLLETGINDEGRLAGTATEEEPAEQRIEPARLENFITSIQQATDKAGVKSMGDLAIAYITEHGNSDADKMALREAAGLHLGKLKEKAK
jgi:hypothetical protein